MDWVRRSKINLPEQWILSFSRHDHRLVYGSFAHDEFDHSVNEAEQVTVTPPLPINHTTPLLSKSNLVPPLPLSQKMHCMIRPISFAWIKYHDHYWCSINDPWRQWIPSTISASTLLIIPVSRNHYSNRSILDHLEYIRIRFVFFTYS